MTASRLATPDGDGRPAMIARASVTICPTTSQLVPTGVSMNRLSDLRPPSVRTGCLSCAGDHEWTAHEGVFAPQ